MKDWYFKLEADIIRDVIDYPHEGYILVQLPDTHMPAGINSGDYRWDGTNYSLIVPTVTLDEYKQNKINELKSIETNKLSTFKSSALGSEHTYLSGSDDMLLLTGEYAYIKGDDYQGELPLWYTVENNNVEHTKAQFIQVYLDCRLNVQTIKYHRATLEAQVIACTDQPSIDLIEW